MATVTIDGLWPNVRPTETRAASTTVKNLFDRMIKSQERRARYRLAMMYDAKTLRSMGMDDAAVQRVLGTK